MDWSLLDFANCSVKNETELLFINLTTVHGVAIVLHATVISIIIAIGLIGSLMVLLLVAVNKRLRHRSILASLNIVSVDTFLTIFYHGVVLTNTLKRGWSYGEDDETICRMYSIITTYLINVRWIAIGLLTTDRLLTVRFPMKYERRSHVFLMVASILVWVIPASLEVLSAPSIAAGYSFRANIPTCVPACINVGYPAYCKLLHTGIVTITFIVGGVLPPFMYIWMCHRARRLQTKYTLGKLTLAVTTGVVVKSTSFQTESNIRNKQAMVTVLLIFLSVFITSLPSYLLVVLRQISLCSFFKIPVEVHFVIADIFLASTALDPLVIMRNRDFRTALRDLLHKLHLCRYHYVADGRDSSTQGNVINEEITLTNTNETQAQVSEEINSL